MSKSKSGWFKNHTTYGKKLIQEVKINGDKITKEDVIGIMKRESDGKIIWLEDGTHSNRGLKHIIEEHVTHFNDIGISTNLLSTFILNTIIYGKIIGYQNSNKSRPIYEYTYCGKTYFIAITISSNGFIVSANQRTSIKDKEKIK